MADVTGDIAQLQRDLAAALTDRAPEGWRRLDVTFRLLTDVHEVDVTVLTHDGGHATMDVSPEAVDAAVRLRAACMRDARGTWFSLRFVIDTPTTFRASANYAIDPRWRHTVDPQHWVRDLAEFPRRPEHLPAWLRARLADAGQVHEAPRADTPDPEDMDAQNRLWARISNVIALHAPADWNHATLTYRAIGDRVELRVDVHRIDDGAVRPWDPPREVPGLLDELRASMYKKDRGTWFQTTAQVLPGSGTDYEYTWDTNPWDDEPPVPALAREMTRFPRAPERVPGWVMARLGAVGLATLGAPSGHVAALRAAEDAAAEMGLDPGKYRIGRAADGAWCLVPENGRWAVFLAHEGERHEQAVFDTARAAVRYFTGHLCLHRSAFGYDVPPDAKRPTDEWPIQPAGEDVGLQLYGGKKIVTLPPGTEIDRYGDKAGNTLYEQGTEFPLRSQPAEDEQLDFATYRLLRPVRAITGTTIAWYDQPGGGTAYVLERSVADLLADGSLEHVPDPHPESMDQQFPPPGVVRFSGSWS